MKKIFWIILIVLIVAVVLYTFLINYSRYPSVESTLPDTLVVETPPDPELLYNIPKDSFDVFSYNVKKNQFLADILLSYGLSYPDIDKFVKAGNSLFDFRKMKVGNRYTCFLSPDTLHRLEHFVYEIDNTNYITVCIDDSITALLNEKEIQEVEKEAYGEIQSSLWLTIKDNNLTPMLAIELSEIYAWTVDFFGIEKGDYFKVLYSEKYVDGQSIGIGKIHAAVFSHHKQLYYAFAFEQDSVFDYFDEKGQSLRKAFLKAPLRFSRISSRYSHSRLHPILKIRRPHHGVDYAAPHGTPVYSIGDGRVINKAWDPKGGGNYVKIKHNSVYTTTYMHLSGFAKGLLVGQSVRQGQLIGYVGATGHATGPHLDFRVSKNGRLVDPLKIESPPVEPVKNENMGSYLSFIESFISKINKISVDEPLAITNDGEKVDSQTVSNGVIIN
ncbi:MAG: peptidoglycan DD-metalloendopeptidase family protein [Bacteroidales bacterium]|nr:peptidoglycan DD-metalloendopeptidase family protein [Bacteroidales bacterium]